MRAKLTIVGLLAACAGALGALTFIPGAVETFLPKRSMTTVGQAMVGGPFEMTNQAGERVRDEAYRGKLMLVYFGFTYCPDICPAGLQVMTAALDELGKDADKVAPIFITVDPERDTPEQMKRYLDSFHPGLVGLTGSAKDVDKAAKAYRVYYRKAEDAALSEYTMDHTSFIYLMDVNGRYITHFAHAVDPDKLAARLRREIAQIGG